MPPNVCFEPKVIDVAIQILGMACAKQPTRSQLTISWCVWFLQVMGQKIHHLKDAVVVSNIRVTHDPKVEIGKVQVFEHLINTVPVFGQALKGHTDANARPKALNMC